MQEERRLGVDNQPYGTTFETLDELAYDNFAYKHSVIGSMADLSAASVEDVAAFFKTYYAPNNAVLAIVGDVDTKTTLEKVAQVLRGDSVAAAAAAGRHDRAAADGRARARRSRIRWRGCRASTWPTRFPPSSSPDDDALDGAGDDAVGRPQLALLRGDRPREAARRPNASRRIQREPRARACSTIVGTVAPGKTPRSSRPRSTPRSRR